MTEEELARTAVAVLSAYLRRKSTEGSAAYNGELEDTLGRVEARFSEPFLNEMFRRFVERPSESVEAGTMQLHLGREVSRDPKFARELKSALAGRRVSKLRNPGRRSRAGIVAAAVVVLLVLSFVVGRTTSSNTRQAAAAPTTVTVEPTPGNSTTASSPPATDTSETSISTSGTTTGSTAPGVPGDGSSVPKETPVSLLDLPRPDDDWNFYHGDHDVQLKQYAASLWNELSTCNSSYYHGEQQFRLKGFSRLIVKAIGTDSTSSAGLAVKFEVFVNDNAVNAVQTVVVNPGETKQLSVDLPSDVFALKLRTSLTTATGEPCRKGNAVWGSPYVVAAGS
jgi:hypothetical protein